MHPPKPDRSAEFERFVPRPRPVAQAVSLAPLALVEIDDDDYAPAATPLEIAHMARVKTLRCVLCHRLGLVQQSGTEVHHLRAGQGGAQRGSGFVVAALCGEGCHRGPRGVHGDRSLLRQAKCTEVSLLAWTLEALAMVDTTGIHPA
jgi:hypothetical protein